MFKSNSPTCIKAEFLYFLRTFQESPTYSSTFQAFENSVAGLCSQAGWFETYLVLQDSLILSGHLMYYAAPLLFVYWKL